MQKMTLDLFIVFALLAPITTYACYSFFIK